MPQRCSICRHQQRAEIDAALLGPDSLRTIAGRFGTSKSALEKHRDKCISAQLAKAKEVSDAVTASTLVDELLKLTQETGRVLARAIAEKDGDLALKAIARLERQLELKGRLLGELEDRGRGGETRIEVVYIDKAVIASAPVPAALPAGPEPVA